jgi:predicted nucleic acid-binding protein
MVIIDTDVLIKCLKNEQEFVDEVTELLESQAAVITPVQITEVYSHALAEDLPMISSFFDLFKVEQFGRKTGELAGEFWQQYKKHYLDLTTADCLMGACAAINEYEIYTLHPKHFPMTEVTLYYKTIQSTIVKTKPRLANY